METLLTVKHLRIMLDAAYREVEKLRVEKARSEGVDYVPGAKPINITCIGGALEALDRLNDERSHLEWWFRAAESRVEYHHFEKLLAGLNKLGVTFSIDPVNENVNIQSRQETRRG